MHTRLPEGGFVTNSCMYVLQASYSLHPGLHPGVTSAHMFRSITPMTSGLHIKQHIYVRSTCASHCADMLNVHLPVPCSQVPSMESEIGMEACRFLSSAAVNKRLVAIVEVLGPAAASHPSVPVAFHRSVKGLDDAVPGGL